MQQMIHIASQSETLTKKIPVLPSQKKKDTYCYSIREADSKNLCLAQIKNQKSYCYSIQSSDIKNQCLAILK